MVTPATDTLTTAPDHWRRQRDATVLGVEIDHLRLYGLGRAEIAHRLRCSEDAVAKWTKANPRPRESWEFVA